MGRGVARSGTVERVSQVGAGGVAELLADRSGDTTAVTHATKAGHPGAAMNLVFDPQILREFCLFEIKNHGVRNVQNRSFRPRILGDFARL